MPENLNNNQGGGIVSEEVVSNSDGSVIGGGQTAIEQLGDNIVAEQESFEALNPTSSGANITNEDRFFGARQPIQRGTSKSGVPIFVANQALTPLGILDKKDAAIDAARRKQAEQRAKFKLDKANRLKNANFQKSFDDAFVGNQGQFINEAKTLYGDNWTLALGSDATDVGRRYRQSLSNFTTLKDQADAFTDKAAEIKSRMENGDTSVSEKTAQLVADAENAIGQFSEGNPVDLVGKMDQMWASVNIDKHLNENIFKNLQAIEDKYMSGVMSDNEYHTQISSHTKRIGDQADQIAARLKKPNGVFGMDPNITEKDIADAIKQRIGDFTATGPKVVDKPSKGDGKDYTDEDLSNRLSKLNKISNPFDGGKSSISDEEAEAISTELVNGKYNGRIVSGSSLVKGEENQDLLKSVDAIFSYDHNKGNSSSIKKRLKSGGDKGDGKLIGAKYTYSSGGKDVTGKIKSIDFDNEGDNNLAVFEVETPSGVEEVTYNLSKAEADSDWETIRDGFKSAYPDSNDRLELNLIASRKGDELAKKPVVIDLTEPGAKWVINDIFNSKEGGTDIPTEDMQMQEGGVASGAGQLNIDSSSKKKEETLQKKEEKPVSSSIPKSDSDIGKRVVDEFLKDNKMSDRAEAERILRENNRIQ